MDRPGPGLQSCDFVRKRIACEVAAEGRVYKGVATELAPHEIFVQLAGSSLPRRGVEVVVHLRDDAIGGDGIELTAVVARREAGGVDARGLTRGIQARVVDAPTEYHALFAGAVDEDTTEVEILVEVASSSDPGSFDGAEAPPLGIPDDDRPVARRPEGSAPGPPSADGTEPSGEAVAADADAGVEDDTPGLRTDDEPAPLADRAPAAAEAARASEPEPEPEPVAARGREAAAASAAATEALYGAPPPPARAPQAIVVYDGDKLQDIYELLERIGARPERARMSGPTRFRGWDRPPRVLIADAQDAVSLDWPQNLIADGVVRIAIARSASAVLGKILRSQGFHYLVRRPVHPRALEVLLRHALHRGSDRRTAERSPLGVDARLATHPWRWPSACTLLELSAVGGRVLTLEEIPLLSQVTLRVSRRRSGVRSVTLRARVVRRQKQDDTGEWLLALRFLEVPADQRGRLDDLLARTAVGPTSALVARPTRRLGARLRERLRPRRRPVGDALAEAAPAAPEARAPAPEPRPERRTAARAAMDREVIALDDGCDRVTAVLHGRDVSTLGMRIDPHPELRVGRRMRVAFYDQVSRGTIEIAAEVVRDDGDRGMGLRFCGMTADAAARLAELVAALPGVESLDGGSRPMVFARIAGEPTPVPASEATLDDDTGWAPEPPVAETPAAEPEPEPDPERPVAEKPAAEPGAETASAASAIGGDAAEAVAEPAARSVAEPITGPTIEPITEAITEPITEPITGPITEPITETISEPITVRTTETIAESVPQPVDGSTDAPAEGSAHDRVDDRVDDPVDEPTDEPSPAPGEAPIGFRAGAAAGDAAAPWRGDPPAPPARDVESPSLGSALFGRARNPAELLVPIEGPGRGRDAPGDAPADELTLDEALPAEPAADEPASDEPTMVEPAPDERTMVESASASDDAERDRSASPVGPARGDEPPEPKPLRGAEAPGSRRRARRRRRRRGRRG